MVWERGLEHAVHAVRLALDRGVRCRLRVLGGGEHLAAISFARHQMRLSEEVELVTGARGGSLVGALRDADLLVDPAVTDTTSPAALIASQAMGIPYVSTPRDCLIQGAGVTVGRRDPWAMADALASLSAEPARRARMGATGAEAGWAAAARALETDLKRLEALYRRAIEGAPPP
jgi:glycosyltransferase involved in cell wall biosynthesis